MSWRFCRRDKGGSNRTWYRKSSGNGGGGPGKPGLTIDQACDFLWEKFNLPWRKNVVLRKPNEPLNLP